MNVSSHVKRILTAVILLPLVAYCIYTAGAAMFLLLLGVTWLAQWEFYGLYWPGRRLWPKLGGLLLGACVLAASWLGGSALAFGALLAGFWLTQLGFLLRFGAGNQENARPTDGILLLGLFYVPAMLQFFIHFSRLEMILCFAGVVVSDVGAYYAGSLVGGPKIWPSVSPKKTWAGSLGGLCACLALCLGFGLAYGRAGWQVWLWLGLALNLAAQLGDFLESAQKRYFGVKDSGRILPGHGGVLDRIDALLAAVGVFAGFRYFFELF